MVELTATHVRKLNNDRFIYPTLLTIRKIILERHSV